MGFGMDELDDGYDANDAIDAFEDEGREQAADKKRHTKSMKMQIQYEVARQLKSQVTIGSLKVADCQRGKTVERTCRCKAKFMARQADIDRGWAKNCSKSCAARFK